MGSWTPDRCLLLRSGKIAVSNAHTTAQISPHGAASSAPTLAIRGRSSGVQAQMHNWTEHRVALQGHYRRVLKRSALCQPHAPQDPIDHAAT